MTVQLLVQIISTLLFPLLGLLAFYLYQLLVQKLPAQQRAALEQFAKQAVLSIEQQYLSTLGPDKKIMARTLIINVFKAFNLPVPPNYVIDMAIEAAVKEMNMILKSPSSS
jgi:LL-H family phage holin